MTASDPEKLKQLGLKVIRLETEAVARLSERIDDNFVEACRLMLDCKGRVIVTGMGKSGHIAGKIAATLASTGTPAFFVHPGEASHGDLGMITSQDVVLALSNSGETRELITIIPLIKRLGVPLISMTGRKHSIMAKRATVHIDVSVAQEACPLGLAPTASTTAALAMGDALAVALLQIRGFTQDDFARSHPAGSLGRRLLLKIEDVMHTGNDIPAVPEDATLSEALLEMTSKKMGMTAVVDDNNCVLGIFTDGDLRRLFEHGSYNIHRIRIAEVMTRGCATSSTDLLAAEAVKIMEQKKINALLVVDDQGRLVGALNMHDLLSAGVI